MPLRPLNMQEIRNIEAMDLAPNANATSYGKSHPVFLVTFRDSAKLVLKADPDVQWITGSASIPDIPYLWDMSAKAAMPTLLMIGRTSNVLDDELVEKMVSVMPNAAAQWFDPGHYIPRQQPDQFTQSLVEFFAEADS